MFAFKNFSFNVQFRIHSLALYDPFCGFMWARCTCGLVVPWDHRLVVPWEREFAPHSNAVIFQFLFQTMIMESSDTVMPTYRNPGRLDMADTTEDGTDVAYR